MEKVLNARGLVDQNSAVKAMRLLSMMLTVETTMVTSGRIRTMLWQKRTIESALSSHETINIWS